MRGSPSEWSSCRRPPQGGCVPRRLLLLRKGSTATGAIEVPCAALVRGDSWASWPAIDVDRPHREVQQRRPRLGPGRDGRRGGRGLVQGQASKSWSTRSELGCWRSPAASSAPMEAIVVAMPFIGPKKQIAERHLRAVAEQPRTLTRGARRAALSPVPTSCRPAGRRGSSASGRRRVPQRVELRLAPARRRQSGAGPELALR
jgi:hypothetical protein